jgi:hypothetical protein
LFGPNTFDCYLEVVTALNSSFLLSIFRQLSLLAPDP